MLPTGSRILSNVTGGAPCYCSFPVTCLITFSKFKCPWSVLCDQDLPRQSRANAVSSHPALTCSGPRYQSLLKSAVLAPASCVLDDALAGAVPPGPFRSLPFSPSVGHCPDPVLVNGDFHFRWPVKVNDNITFTCNEDYILKGSNWSQCLEDHTWVPPLPICKSREYECNGANPEGVDPQRHPRHSPHPREAPLYFVSGKGLDSHRRPRDECSQRAPRLS